MALRTNYLVLPLTLLLVYAIFPLNQHLGLFLIRVCLVLPKRPLALLPALAMVFKELFFHLGRAAVSVDSKNCY